MGNKEVRDILLGRILRQDEQFWTVAPVGTKFRFHGVKDGAGDVRLFGVIQMSRFYQTEAMETAVAFAATETALYSMGYPMRLVSMPENKTCLYAPNWIAPVLLTAQRTEDGLQISAYTGRSFLIGRLRCRIALWILEQRLPKGIICVGRKPDGEKADKEKPSGKKEKRKGSPKKKKKAPEQKEK